MRIPASMWALTQAGPYRLSYGETPAPDPASLGPGDVLIKTLVGGICGSDLPFFAGYGSPFVEPGTHGFPLHEVVGEVIATNDDTIAVGDRVVGWATGQDGLSEYVITAGSSVHAFGQDLEPGTAIALQPLACVLYAVEQIGDVTGKTVAVLGVGPIGALFAHVLKNRGAAKVIGIDRVDRSDVQDILGIDEFVLADVNAWSRGLGETGRPNIVVEAIGHQVETLTAAVNAAAYEGLVFYFGIPNDDVYPLPMTALLRKNMTLTTGVTALAARRRVLAEAEIYLDKFPELAAAYVTSPFSFRDAQEAFETAIRPRTGQLKVTLTNP
jgi:L-iditol 2-dehydrogenase